MASETPILKKVFILLKKPLGLIHLPVTSDAIYSINVLCMGLIEIMYSSKSHQNHSIIFLYVFTWSYIMHMIVCTTVFSICKYMYW